ncbi:MAG: Maf family protein [Steroidobacterales bacterium]
MFLKSQPPLILASTSAYRRELLGRLRIPFSAMGPGVDETRLDHEAPPEMVTRLARAKADAISVQHPDAWVIGSDQAAVCFDAGGSPHVLGKPGTLDRLVAQLQDSSGRTLTFLTAVAVVRHEGGALHEFLDTTRVRFRTLDAATIRRYVGLESPLDCAGGFKSEGLGIALCESIESQDPTALIGLPLIRLAATLREAGLQIP